MSGLHNSRFAAQELDPAILRSVFERAAEAAALHTLSRFRTALVIENKARAGFDPVTRADRDAETAIRAVISDTFPDHGIVGEELPDRPTDGRFTWMVDPIDGTRAYVSGLPLWGTLIGLTRSGKAIAGAMSQPYLEETFIAIGGAAVVNHRDGSQVLKTSGTTELAEARMATTTPALFATIASRAAYDAVEARARISRYGTDCYGYCMLAAGHIDLVIEEGLKPFDIVALIPIIEAAGGIVTTWSGDRAETGGQIVAAATPALHAQALDLLRAAAR